MAKKKKSRGEDPDPNEFAVELHLPPKLYDKAKDLHDSHDKLFFQLVRSVFPRDELYGISRVKIKRGAKSADTKDDEVSKQKSPKKTCDISLG